MTRKLITETDRELTFLEGLGEWSKHPKKKDGTGLSRLGLQHRYRESMKNRDRCGRIDKSMVLSYLEKHL